jgi:Fe-S cluster assembly protein SufD
MYNLLKIKTIKVGEKTILEIKKSGRTNVRINRNGQAHVVCRINDSKDFKHELKIELVGQGAECLVSAIFYGKATDHHNFNVILHHQAKSTKGDILIRGVYENEASGNFSGLIKIDRKAQLANSFFQNDVLLLDQAAAISVPTLEIEANDVKASHGSTTSRIDEDQLFYVRSRGIPLPLAKRMVINGFFQPILQRLPPALQRRINSNIYPVGVVKGCSYRD